jgi:hypothetical protein
MLCAKCKHEFCIFSKEDNRDELENFGLAKWKADNAKAGEYWYGQTL